MYDNMDTHICTYTGRNIGTLWVSVLRTGRVFVNRSRLPSFLYMMMNLSPSLPKTSPNAIRPLIITCDCVLFVPSVK